MLHHSKFPLFALPVLLCVAAEGCLTPPRQLLEPDPQQTEEIARQSAVNAAHIIFNDGDSVKGYQVGVRKDTTEWYEKDSLGTIVSDIRHVAPTSDIASISISEPKVFEGMLTGVAIGAVLGALIYEGAKIPSAPDQDASFGDQLVNGIALGIGFKGCTIGMGALFGVGGLSMGASARKEYYVRPASREQIHQFNAPSDSIQRDRMSVQPVHWFNAQTDTVSVDTTTKVDTTKLH